MTHREWIRERATNLLRSLGTIERDMEGEAVVSLVCLNSEATSYRATVGVAPPATLDKEVAAAYWDAVAMNPQMPRAPGVERERQIAATNRFEASLGFRPER